MENPNDTEIQTDVQQNSEQEETPKETKPLTEEEKIKQEKNQLFSWTKVYAASVFILNIILLILIVLGFAYNQKKITRLTDSNLKLKKEIGPLKDFHNRKEKLVDKELYDQQQQQILALQQEKVELSTNLKHSKQMIINLSRSLEDARMLNETLAEENKSFDANNKDLSRELKYEKMKLSSKDKEAQ